MRSLSGSGPPSPDPLQVVLRTQLVRQGDWVGRLVLAVQTEDGAPNRLVRGSVEVGRVEQLAYFGDHRRRVHAGPQHGGFGVHVVRRNRGEVVRRRPTAGFREVWRVQPGFVRTGH